MAVIKVNKTRIYIVKYEEKGKKMQAIFNEPFNYLSHIEKLQELGIQHRDSSRMVTFPLMAALVGIREE